MPETGTHLRVFLREHVQGYLSCDSRVAHDECLAQEREVASYGAKNSDLVIGVSEVQDRKTLEHVIKNDHLTNLKTVTGTNSFPG